MRTHALVAVAVLLLTSVALGAPPGPPVTRNITLTALPATCPSGATGVCYGYDGLVPGPTIDINVGDTVKLTLVNQLTQAVSFHVHGMVLAVANDGIPAHAGTQFPDSSVPAGGSFTYSFRAAYAGLWHYHDHTMGADGAGGVRKGLFGTIIVRNGGDVRPATVIDWHLLDKSADANITHLVANASVGRPFEIDATALGNDLWTVTAADPHGTVIWGTTLGPALSDRWLVAAPVAGTYTWTAHAKYHFNWVAQAEVVAS